MTATLGGATVVASKTTAQRFTLTDGALATTDGMNFALSGITIANLTGSALNDTFDTSDWTGTGRIEGGVGTRDNGKDVLAGSNGNDVLVGGSGDDVLKGDAGRDLVIGGVGKDVLLGGLGDDILIAGYTDYDVQTASHRAALAAIVSEWSGANTYATRVSNIKTGVGDGLYKLSSLTVHGDGSAATDALFGEANTDWFIESAVGEALDEVAGEVLDTIP